MAPGQMRSLIGSIRRKPPTAPDQKTDTEAGGAKEANTSILHDVLHGNPKQTRFLAEALPAITSGKPLDDKELLLEHGVSMLQSLPSNSGLGNLVSDGFINMLYNDLPHPSTTMAGPTTRYRRHDGGNNNIWNPEMGKAGSPYARNVPPMKPRGGNLPDPELVFENLLKRPEGKFKEHPSGLNRLFFSFATIVIHECFQTNRKNQWINETSSYVDLSTLYGNTNEEQKRINEAQKYGDWDSLDKEEQDWQDNDVFQLARNINVGFFATVVLKDYVAAILNTPRADSNWWLNLGAEIKMAGNRIERGTGNVVSVEFAVLYHWHAALSAADARWMEDLLRANLPELGSLDEITPQMFYKVVMQEGHKLMPPVLPKDWTFNGLRRGEDGRFNDSDLAELIKDCIEEPAHAFGPHGTPASLKVVDIMGMLQAREVFNVCTLNEFRAYLNLKPYDNFEEWCEDKETARAAELLYSHIDNMELYPGLMAECTKPAMPGSGVCPGQTTGRGILDDAVALVRGDRFLSYDFNSSTLTNWGASKLTDLPGGAYGGMLPKLLFTGLPNSFTGTSSYALLPFYTNKAVRGILKNNKVYDRYDLHRPPHDVAPIVVYTVEGCANVLMDENSFRAHHVEPKTIESVFFEDRFESKLVHFFSAHASHQIKYCSLKYPGSRRVIDIVRDVANITPIAWLAHRFAIPVKSAETPRGLFTLPQLYDIFAVIAGYQNFNLLPANEWALRHGAQENPGSQGLRDVLELHLKIRGTGGNVKSKIADHFEKGSAFEVGAEADALYHALNSKGRRGIGELVEECLAFAAPMASMITQQTSLLIDLFLSKGYEIHKEQIVALAHQADNDETAMRKLQAYVYEGMLYASSTPGIVRTAAKDTTVVDGRRGMVHVRAQQKVLAATSVAAMDAVGMPLPRDFNPGRPAESYALLLPGSLAKVAGPAITAMLKEIFKLKDLRRQKGKAGSFTRISGPIAPSVNVSKYLDTNAKESAYPTNLMLEYDDPAAAVHAKSNGAVNGVNGSHGIRATVEMAPKRKQPAATPAAPKARRSKLAKDHSISADEEAEIQEAFNLFVKSPTHPNSPLETSISTADVRRALIALDAPPASPSGLRELLSVADPHGSGWVDYEHFFPVAALQLSKRVRDGDEEARMREVAKAYRLFTRGEEREITVQDLRRVARDLREEVPEGVLRDMVREAKGGGLGGVGFEEFEGVMRRAGVFG
ncbi:linoleate diol synthase [Teratosphaeria destructans]|uniref:Linoleate diol synthase n=1 Tax=Teratosphaeria destructans TaxID=418781 RepID=A0A9W7W565_9PEZI|nr:linoleate diol synthase [Teratosphaeria destructans]